MLTKITKKVVMYVAAVLVLLTLVCMCLLGNTYARYTTGTKGTADAELSLWNVSKEGGSLTGGNTVAFDTSGLSPNKDGGTTTDVYNMTSVMQVAAIKIDAGTEVDVKVTISATSGGATYYDTSSNEISTWSGSGIDQTGNTPTETEVKSAVKMYIGYFTSTDVTSMPAGTALAMGSTYSSASYSGTDLTMLYGYGSDNTSNNGEITWSTGTDSTTYIYVYAWVTWTTKYSSYSSDATNSDGLYYADLLDTWIGANVSALKSEVSVVAVQNSQNPTTSA